MDQELLTRARQATAVETTCSHDVI